MRLDKEQNKEQAHILAKRKTLQVAYFQAICKVLGLVRETGLEPVRHKTHAPQTCLSADSSTLATAKVIISNLI